MRRGSVGLDGAASQYCDLSGRGLATAQIERTLRVFETAETIDLSNNEIETIPSTIPATIITLDISFNLISNVQGIDRLKNLQEIHLGFNRLMDVSVLEFCPRLQRVNLSGNRLMNTRGLETLVCLERLDLSENLIEFPEALRPLSLNQNLTHLTLRGNPIATNTKHDYRVLLLDMIPSVLMLDDKKIRSAVKYKTSEGAGGKSLSYARLYDEKKQFVIRNQNRPRPATTVKPLIAGECVSKYDGTMFLQPAVEPSHERVRSLQLQQQLQTENPSHPPQLQSPTLHPPAAPTPRVDLKATKSGGGATSATAAAPATSAPYMSLYDRLAHANGMQLTKSAVPPSKPIESRPTVHANSVRAADRSRKHSASSSSAVNQKQPKSSSIAQSAPVMSPSKSTLRGSISRSSAPVRAIPDGGNDSSVKRPTTPGDHFNSTNPTPAGARRPKNSFSGPPALDAKQKNVLNVIQNLIQHKKQTLATLARHPSASPVAT